METPRGPKLRWLHAQAALNRGKLTQLRRLSSDVITSSLAPGQPGALKVRPDGTVLDGHHRLTILEERRDDINLLPREIMEREEQ